MGEPVIPIVAILARSSLKRIGERGGVSPPVPQRMHRGADAAPLA